MRRVMLIFGATSAIAQATAKRFALQRYEMHLVARAQAKLDEIARDLKVHGATDVFTYVQDIADLDSHQALVDQILERCDVIDIILHAHGVLGTQAEYEKDIRAVADMIQINYLSIVSLNQRLLPFLEKQGRGTIAIISSVAGDRGRASNFFYGSSKAALTAYSDGLRARLLPHGVHVCTIKPGFVASPMTANVKQGPLFASAEQAGLGIEKAILNQSGIAYIPKFWWFIMFVVKGIPDFIFKKLKF